jgi:hypothetical protein
MRHVAILYINMLRWFGYLLRNDMQRTYLALLSNKSIIQAIIAPDTLIYTDEYDIYEKLNEWGYQHKTVCHSKGEFARDEDGGGFCEVHVNTIEGFWYLLTFRKRCLATTFKFKH